MTTDPSGQPPASPPRRRWRVGTPLVFALSGALFVASANQSDGTDLRPGRTTDLAGLVKRESAHVAELEERANRLARQVDALSAGVDDETVRRAREETRALRGPAGRTPVSGPGVTVVLSDAPRELREDADDINRLLVHQQDIQAVVNAMWDAGARAITIQGQRVITTTGIKCAGSSVELNGLYFPQPYVISAIGDPEMLAAAIDSDENVTNFREDAADETIQVGWSMAREDELTAPAYEGLRNLEHAQVLEVEAEAG